jgi:FMN phosphatase YigB (HAD superfamily)
MWRGDWEMSLSVIFFDLGDTLVTSVPKAFVPGSKALLNALHLKGFRLGIISNTGNLASRADILNLLPNDFSIATFESDLVLFSSEVHIAKPDPQIFQKAIAKAGVSAEQCLYCSENIVETLVAQHEGMFSIRVQPPPGNDLDVLLQRITEFQNAI